MRSIIAVSRPGTTSRLILFAILAALLLCLQAPAGAGTVTYTYDEAGRLTKANYGSKVITYTYDSAGNVLEEKIGAPETGYDLTVAKSGTGGGTVTSSPSGISCGSICTASFTKGSTVTLSVAPAAGSLFTGWSGACKGTGICRVAMTGAKSVGAVFTAKPVLTITKSGTGTGTVTSSPAGISCGETCTAPFNKGAVVTLTPAPAAGSVFTRWTGGCTGTGICRVTMTKDVTVTAQFTTGSCTYTVAPKVGAFTFKGGKATLTVTARGSAFCPAPAITTDAAWITYTSSFSGTKGTITVTIPEYGMAATRTGKLTVGTGTFTATQTGKPCSLTLSSSASPLMDAGGGQGSFTVTTAPSDCTFTAVANKAWIAATVAAPKVNYTVGANAARPARQGKITVTTAPTRVSKVFTVNQKGK